MRCIKRLLMQIQAISSYYYSFFLIILCLSSISYAELLSDPTRPADWQKPTIIENNKETLILPTVVDAIIITPKRRVAIIQGQVITVGEHIKGYTLKKINTYNVVLANTTQTLILPLISTNISTIIQYEQ